MRIKTAVLGFSILVGTMAFMPLASFAVGDAVSEKELAATPDATFDFEAKSARAIVGAFMGEGVLHFQGKDYPFSIKAATLGGAGLTKAAGTGKVFHLDKVEDFAGQYVGIGIGAAVVKSKGASAFRNNKGVVVNTKSTGEGVALNLGASGVTVTLKN